MKVNERQPIKIKDKYIMARNNNNNSWPYSKIKDIYIMDEISLYLISFIEKFHPYIINYLPSFFNKVK